MKKSKKTKIKSFINEYNREVINFSSEKDVWKKIEKNYVTIVLNVLYAKKELLMFQNIGKNKKTEKNAKLSPKDNVIILQLKNYQHY